MIPRALAKLTESDALHIYHCEGRIAAAISKLYDVSEKAVRDI